MRRLIMAALVAGCYSASMGGGSLSTSEIMPMLEDDKLGSWLLQRFELCEVASGTRLGRHWPHLGGARHGPYYVNARDRESTATHFRIRLETRITYYAGDDALWTGSSEDFPNEAHSIFRSTKFEEELTALNIAVTTQTLCNGEQW